MNITENTIRIARQKIQSLVGHRDAAKEAWSSLPRTASRDTHKIAYDQFDKVMAEVAVVASVSMFEALTGLPAVEPKYFPNLADAFKWAAMAANDQWEFCVELLGLKRIPSSDGPVDELEAAYRDLINNHHNNG